MQVVDLYCREIVQTLSLYNPLAVKVSMSLGGLFGYCSVVSWFGLSCMLYGDLRGCQIVASTASLVSPCDSKIISASQRCFGLDMAAAGMEGSVLLPST